MSYQSQVVALSPYAYYRLEEASGASAADSSGNGRTGTISPVSTFPIYGILGIPSGGNGFLFSGGSRVELADTTDVTEFTVIAWIKTTQASFTSNAQIAGRWGTIVASRIAALVLGTTGIPSLSANNGTEVRATSPTAINDGEWHMLVGVMEGLTSSKTLRLYIDGVQVATATGTITQPLTQDTPFSAGANGTSSGRPLANSRMDEIAYWNNVALSAGQISALYATGSVAPSIPVTRWNGSTEVPVAITRWNGSVEQPVVLKRWDGTTEVP
jgi:hypothetical protein